MTLYFSVNFDKVRRKKVERLLEKHMKNIEENGLQEMTEQEKDAFKKSLLKKLEDKTKKSQ